VLTRGKVVARDRHGKPLRALETILDITEHKKNQERIRALTGDLIKAQEDERSKIALDLHDDIAQRVASLAFFLLPLTSDLARHQPDMGSEIARVYEVIEQLVESVRSMSYELRPYSLDREGLVSAIRTYCTEFAERNNIRVEFFPLDIEEDQLDRDTEINLFRLVQEASNNVKKHPRASAVTVRLQRSMSHLMMTIQDNG
jgi:signal transduction histidine kinase